MGIFNKIKESVILKKHGVWYLRGGLDLETIQTHFAWLLEAKIKKAVLGYYYDNAKKKFMLIWYEGTWIEGVWEDGIWKGGTWKDGEWKDGTWEHGNWNKGVWYNGVWEFGCWTGGTWGDGEWKRGFIHNFHSYVNPKKAQELLRMEGEQK